ncbi:hypothetical protein ROS1_28560 [Roseibium sp. ROS1]
MTQDTENLAQIEVTETALAGFLGMSRTTLSELRRERRLTAIPGTKRPVRYNLQAAVRENNERLREAAAGRSVDAAGDDSQIDAVRESALLKRAQRQLIEAKLNQMQGDLVDRETMQAAINVVCSTARTRILSMPAALSSRLHGLTRSDQAAITEACHQVLQDLADDSARIPDLLKKRVLQDAESLIDAAAKDNRK